MKKFFLIIFAKLTMFLPIFFLYMSVATPVNAVERWCGTCYYEVVVTHINGRSVRKVINVGNFKAKGEDSRRNEARRRARDACNRCMKTHWNNRTGHYIPDECKTSKNGLGVYGYNIRNLQREIERKACSLVGPDDCKGTAEIHLSIFRYISGDTGCGPNLETTLREKIVDGYLVKCNCPIKLLEAPELISPADRTVFYHSSPRTTTLAWKPVTGAKSYTIEIFYGGRIWQTKKNLTNTCYSFDFPGRNEGTWRVRAVDVKGKSGKQSKLRSFSFKK